ncbi:MAG: rhomboid family intramembrane serine protease [Gemmatimonadales bacterium]|nr:rhomboid family intramembrane serine protease [Gemmatimonadales bacterium]MYG49034.1 rhomboid family intramembrane serine protease [Gemmatimonadales bacterium]MYK00884.1 rhomboid family intramembrane serine protease [Candidatus Palauibacter ramosifaciens]
MTRVVGQLLLINVVAYVFTSSNPVLMSELWLVPAQVLTRPWTLLTYQFLHGGVSHIFFNMLALFFFGPKLEALLGSKGFLRLYLLAGLVGALVHILWTIPAMSQGSLYVPMVGASAAVYGVLFGYARYWPRDRVMIWFVIPVQVRFLVLGFTVLSLWLGLGGVGGSVAHFAHLGGFLGGWLYLRLRASRSSAAQFRKKAESPGVRMGERELNVKWGRIEPSTLHPVNRAEYERIADKLKAAGWSALTDRERTFVERFGGFS